MSDELNDLKFQVELLNNKVYGELDATVRTIDTKVANQQSTIDAYISEYTEVRDIVHSEIYTFLSSLTFDDLCKFLFSQTKALSIRQSSVVSSILLHFN